jgi:DNA-binding SARP family transcriptional activator
MPSLRISLFGKFHVQCGEQTLGGFDTRKVQELFCYLLLNRDRSHPRETLADFLWNDAGVQAKSYLRKTLWQLQSALGAPSDEPTTPALKEVLIIDSEWVRFNHEADYWLDVVNFEAAFAQVQDIPGAELSAGSAHMVKSAVELYRGNLLEGWYADWCLYERERLQHLYLAMLDKLMEYCASNREYETGVTYGVRALRYDRARECTHRRLMRLYYLAGDRTAALHQYERCVAALQEELDVQPARSTIVLHERIRADQLDIALPGARDHSLPPRMSTPDVLQRLLHLQQTLADAHRQVLEEIRVAELAIRGSPYDK